MSSLILVFEFQYGNLRNEFNILLFVCHLLPQALLLLTPPSPTSPSWRSLCSRVRLFFGGIYWKQGVLSPNDPKKGVSISCFWIDTNLKWGQVRVLNEDIVRRRMDEILVNPPSNLVRLTVWLEPGVFFSLSQSCIWVFFIFGVTNATRIWNFHEFMCLTASQTYIVLSGQHIFSACSRIAASRTKDHLPVPRWVSSHCGWMDGWNGWISWLKIKIKMSLFPSPLSVGGLVNFCAPSAKRTSISILNQGNLNSLEFKYLIWMSF